MAHPGGATSSALEVESIRVHRDATAVLLSTLQPVASISTSCSRTMVSLAPQTQLLSE
jgi:hypothetical protein